MSFQLFSPWPFLSLLLLPLLILVKIQPSLSNPEFFHSCSRQFRCGNITAGFPFWGGGIPQACGHPNFELRCEKDIVTMTFGDADYRVLDVHEKEQVLRIARKKYLDGSCLCPQNTTIDEAFFHLSAGYEMVKLLYSCPTMFPVQKVSTCYLKDVIDYGNGIIQIPYIFSPVCNKEGILVPVPEILSPTVKRNKLALQEALEGGFEVNWKLNPCEDNCEICGYDFSKNKSTCYCSHGRCQQPSGSFFSKRRYIFLGIAAAVGAMIIILSVLIFWKKKTEDVSILLTFWRKKTENDQDMEAFIRNYRSLSPKRYNYSDIKRMTKSFSDKLGKGGYGEVYKGKLPDGRLVAVKVLNASKGNGEEFINEVASISRTSHVNIVTFLGFCYAKKKRALVYEFMPNGSLDRFLCDQETSRTKPKLEWRTMYQIGVGIARGLEYLHRGCNVRIVHFDIKPHNILLDKDFCPKISDFGLAKQSKKKESVMSMLDARGTIGYIAPEVFCRSFGGVSHKSDVYSYGMMILEMVGGRKNIDVRMSDSSDIYFPDSIFKHLEPGSDFQFHGVVTEEEKEMAKKMITVSLWCIQTNPSDRPSMTNVVDMLEGSLEHLQIPPKPTLSSPTKSAKHSSLSSLSTELASLE